MFRTVHLSIIRSLFTVHSATVYVIQVCRQLSSRTRSCSKAVYKPVWHIPLLSVQWINSWWWTDELSETCRVSCQNKFVKLVYLVGFIIKKLSGQLNITITLVLNKDSQNTSHSESSKTYKPKAIGTGALCTFLSVTCVLHLVALVRQVTAKCLYYTETSKLH